MNLEDIPILVQRQDSVHDQLGDLVAVANRMGMHDAADALKQLFITPNGLDKLEYGCHCDLDEGQEPDGCVIDEGRLQDCFYAKEGMRKEQCKYWKIK